jgi:uncharacterized membrane protein
MAGEHRDLVVVCLWAAAAPVVVSLTDGVALRLLACAPLALFLPGYALLRALGLRNIRPLEWHVLAVGSSVAVLIFGGLALNGVGWLVPIGWAAWLSAATVIASLAAVLRGTPAPASSLSAVSKPFELRHYATIAAAVLVTAGAFGLVIWDGENYRQFRYTAFWMLPEDPARPSVLTVGATNAEGEPTTYDVELKLGGRTLAVWRSISLRANESFTREIVVAPLLQRRQKVEAWLFKSADRNLVYRKASVYVGGT